jgi:probable F420-dependent oxidoreductase
VRIENDSRLSVKDLVELAALAERRGFECVWVPEGGGRDALTLLTAFACATSKIRLATGILPIFHRTPTLTAMSAAGLAAASGNRFILGLGTGHEGTTVQTHGVAFARPVGRMRETVAIVRGLLRGESVALQGREFVVQGARLGRAVQGVSVPIYIAALGPKMVALSGEAADGVLLNWTAASYLPNAVQQVHNAARAANRNPSAVDIAGYVRVAVVPDEAAARKALQRQIASYASYSYYRDFFAACGFGTEMQAAEQAAARGDADAAANAITKAIQDEVAVVGSAEHCRAEIERRRGMGLQLPVIAPFAVDDVKASYTRTINAFGE